MVVVIIVVMAATVLAILSLPFFLKLSKGQSLYKDPFEQIRDEKDSLYQSIDILQNDFLVGLVSAEEYQSRFDTSRNEIANMLRLEEELGKESDSIEKEVRLLRKKKK